MRTSEIVHNKHPIEQSFRVWINNYPESFHPLDMERYYAFVKCVCRYSRREKGYNWLKEKIEKSGKGMGARNIEFYCHKFMELQKFYKVPCWRVYEY